MKKLLIILLSVVLFMAIIFVGASAYLGYTLTRAPRVPLDSNPGQSGFAYEDVSFPSLDKGIILRGWFLPSGEGMPGIIMVHGNGGNRNDTSIGMLEIAGKLVKKDYNVLMFDLRGYGESDGSTVGGGYLEKKDLEGAVAYLKRRGFVKIGVLGFSLGAVTSLLAAAEDKDLDAVVADSSFGDLNDIMSAEFSKRTKAPSVFLRPILFMIKIMYGVDFTAIRPVEAMPEISPRPVFLIHGSADETIPVAEVYKLKAASINPLDRLWVAPGAEHTRAYKKYPDEYLEKVTAFFNQSLKAQ